MPRSTNTQFAVAVHVLAYLAGVGAAEGRPVGSEELAASAAVNPVHIRRLLGPLREAGLVRSRPGARGGWELGREPSGIALVEVWSLLQGDDPVLGLHGPSPACPVGVGVQGALVELDRGVAAAVRRELAGVSVSDVLERSGLVPGVSTGAGSTGAGSTAS